MIDYKIYLDDVRALQSENVFRNVVKDVTWTIEFFDTDYPNEVFIQHRVHTILDTDNIKKSNFKSIESLRTADIERIIVDKMGGVDFINSIMDMYTHQLQYDRIRVEMVKVDISKL